MHEKIFAEIERRSDELIADVQELIRIPSVNPGDFEADAARVFGEQLGRAGIAYRIVESAPKRANVLATLCSDMKGGILFNGHLDVVPTGDETKWSVPPFSGEIRDGRVIGRGTTDMKGAVSAFALAMKVIKNAEIPLRKGVYLHAVADEECGGRFGTGWLAQNGYLPDVDMGIVGECSTYKGEVGIVRACTGVTQIGLTSKGKAAHASRPYEGNNAVINMCRVLVAIQDTFELDKTVIDDLLPLSTIAPGTVINGGIKVNIIPDLCKAEMDLRVVPGMTKENVKAQLDGIIATVKALHPEVDVTCEFGVWDPATLVAANAPVIEAASRAVERALGYVPKHMKRPGTTDARFLNAAGIPAPVAFGPGDVLIGNMHNIDENIGVQDLIDWSKIYASMILDVSA